MVYEMQQDIQKKIQEMENKLNQHIGAESGDADSATGGDSDE
jgi:hypothetical protein